MNKVDFRDPVALDAALRQSQKLWPDPFDGPEVPPRELLAEYERGGAARLPFEHGYRIYLPKQIAESINCQRALEEIRAENDPGHILHPEISAEEQAKIALQAWKSFNASQPQKLLLPAATGGGKKHGSPTRQSVDVPAVDQIWTTSHEVKRFDGAALESRYTWHPINVLLKLCPMAAGGDVVWRGIPCTPLVFWGEDMVGDEEAIVDVPGTGLYVVHFRLEYPVSQAQLHACVATVADSGIRPGTVQATRDLLLERQRLKECADWLSATADARLAKWKWQAEISGLLKEVTSQDWSETVKRSGAAVPATAATALTSTLLWKGSLSDFLKQVVRGESPEGMSGFAVKICMAPHEDQKGVSAQWELKEGTDPAIVAALRPGLMFFLVDRSKSCEVGRGVCQEQGVLKLTESSLPDIQNSDPAQWIILLATGAKRNRKEVQFVHASDEELRLYLDKKLDSSRHARARAHLDLCMRCEERLAELLQKAGSPKVSWDQPGAAKTLWEWLTEWVSLLSAPAYAMAALVLLTLAVVISFSLMRGNAILARQTTQFAANTNPIVTVASLRSQAARNSSATNQIPAKHFLNESFRLDLDFHRRTITFTFASNVVLTGAIHPDATPRSDYDQREYFTFVATNAAATAQRVHIDGELVLLQERGRGAPPLSTGTFKQAVSIKSVDIDAVAVVGKESPYPFFREH